MGTPNENPSGYLSSSVMAHAETMKGKLMLIHGLIDENVHFRHSGDLIKRGKEKKRKRKRKERKRKKKKIEEKEKDRRKRKR